MYVRWRVTSAPRLQRRFGPDAYRLAAWLVRSRRTSAGPRASKVAYLGSIRSINLPHPYPRSRFWLRVDATFERLALDDHQRLELSARLAERISRPSPAETAQAEHEAARYRQATQALLAGVRRFGA